jgi:hypothetical protein
LKPGDKDHVTGWSFDRLRGLGEGIWEFSSCVPATANA